MFCGKAILFKAGLLFLSVFLFSFKDWKLACQVLGFIMTFSNNIHLPHLLLSPAQGCLSTFMSLYSCISKPIVWKMTTTILTSITYLVSQVWRWSEVFWLDYIFKSSWSCMISSFFLIYFHIFSWPRVWKGRRSLTHPLRMWCCWLVLFLELYHLLIL